MSGQGLYSSIIKVKTDRTEKRDGDDVTKLMRTVRSAILPLDAQNQASPGCPANGPRNLAACT